MSESTNKGPNAFAAYMVVTFVSGAASVFIALVVLTKFTQVTDSGIWAMAVMIAAPALLGIGVSYFIYRTAATGRRGAEPDQAPPSPDQEGHFREGRPFEGHGG